MKYASSEDDRSLVARVAAGVPEPWGAVIVLARPDGTGIEVLSGGIRLSERESIDLLRAVLADLDGRGGA